MKNNLNLKASFSWSFVVALVVLPITLFGQLSGSYSINSGLATSGNNFASFTDLAAALNGAGISGPVTVNVVAGSGPYTEQFALGTIAGSSATNTITINGNGETIAFTYTTGTNYGTLNFNGTTYVSINNLTIQNTDGACVIFAYHCLHFQFSSCTFNASTNAYGVVGLTDPLWLGQTIMPISDLTISNSQINGGYGIEIDGLDSCSSVSVLNNTISGGVYIGGSLAVNVIGNIVDATNSYYGIRVYKQGTGASAVQVTNNKVKGSGISVSAHGSAQYPILIANNAIYEYVGENYSMGIEVTGENIHVVHNSISMSTTTWWDGDVFGISADASQPNVVIKNNNIVINNQSTGIWCIGLELQDWSGINPTFTSDYNNIIITNPNGFCHYAHTYYTGHFLTLASWQAAFSNAYDQNSHNLDPLYTNSASGDLTPTNLLLGNLGIPIAGLTTDITGATRHATTPDIGAWEFGGTTIVWYLDADNDGWYTQTQQAASSPGTGWTSTSPTGGNNDCDDNDGTKWQTGNLFIDADGDGWAGNGGTPVSICYGAVPTGYAHSVSGTDCDDANSSVNHATVWYFDADLDGHYTSTQSACSAPGPGWSSTQPSGGSYDCDDSDISVWQYGDFFVDADGDGYSLDPNTTSVCFGTAIPAGYIETPLGLDCNDNDASVWIGQTWYLDFDNDGYYVNSQFVCNSPGTGWNTTATSNGDCDDNNPNASTSQMWYLDEDGDGHAPNQMLSCGSPGSGWTLTQSVASGDCNDNDPNVWTHNVLFIDADADGFYGGNGSVCYGNIVPYPFSLGTLGPDCNDNDASSTVETMWYLDADGDGFYVQSQFVCSSPGNGWTNTLLTGTFGDCDDNNDAVWQSILLFADADGDGYSPNTSAVGICYGLVLPAGYNATTLGFDCYDNNLLINAGAQRLEFSGGSNFMSSIIYPQQGTSYTNFQFEATYFDANGALPPPTYPRVYLDYEGNGLYNNANDRAIIMTPFDAGDLNTVDGKRYIGTINTLPTGTNWLTSVRVTAGSCLTQIGPFNYPDVLVLPDLQIFANNITFSSANPAVSSPLTINAVITNVSDYAAQNFVVHLVNEYDASIVYPDIVVSNLAAHTSTTVTWNITTPAVPAWCPMRVVVDYTNVIAESNELDNNAVRPFTNSNFAVPGTIAITGSVVPPVSFSSVGNVLSLSGSASYSGVAVNMANLSVAGAEVNFTIIETGANYIGYTDAQGNFNAQFVGPLLDGNYTISGYITDFTLTGFLPVPISFVILPVCKPDLISTLTVSSNTIVEGQSVTASVDVTNAGCATAPASVLIFNQSGGSPALTNINVPSLAPGATFSASLGSILFAAPGNYGICSTADGDFAIDESNEYNNVDCEGITVLPALPEIYVQHGPSPMFYNCSGTVPLYAEVANSGGAATGNFNCQVRVKQGLTIVQTFNVPVSSIASLSYTAFTVNFNVPSNGSYTVEIICDNTEVVIEVNETNNTSEFAVDILLCQPDLIVGDCEFVDATSANTYYTGTMDLNATIFNNGNATAFGPIPVKFELSNGTSYTTQILGNLAPGASALATVNVPAFISTSTTLTVIADYTNSIAELHESNNLSEVKRTSWEFYPVVNLTSCGANFWDAQYQTNQTVYLSAAFRAEELYDAATLDIKFEVAGPGIIGNLDLGNAQAINVEQTCGFCPRIAVLPSNFVFSQVGIYTFTITVDPNNVYIESNETNNVLVVTVEVSNLPDMRTLSQFINPSSLNPLLNQNVNFTVTYENIGASNITDQMKLQLLVDNVPIESIYPVPGLVTNDNATYNFSIPWSSNIPGAHIIRAIIDSDDDVLEQTNANNEATRAIVVGDAANLFFNLFTSPTLNPNLNDPMQIVANIKNIGALVSTADVKFYYVDDFLNEVFIDTRSVTVAGNDNTTITVPWIVLDNKTTIIGRIVNSTDLEFDYTDNEASFAIGAMDLVLQTTEACDPGDLGSVSASVTGGTPPYNYNWSNGSVSSTLIDVAGTYNLVVTDNTGQSVSGSATIDECTVNCVPVATSFSQTECNSYLWNGVLYTTSGQHVQTLSTVLGCDSVVTLNLTLGTSGSSAVSCSISSAPSNSVFTGGSTKNLYLGYGAQSTTLNVSSTGGSSWTYSWSGNTALLSNTNTNNPVFTPIMGGSYTFTVTTTNEFGCTGTCDITINVVDARCGKSNNPKVIVCHNGHEICISENAVPAHLSNHSGDIIGPCPPAKAIAFSNDEDELEIVAYPSPFTDAFHVELIKTSASNYSIAIFDMNGRLLEKHENLELADNPDFGRDLPQGFYMIEVTQDGIGKMAKVSKVF